jgi:hypothetical protein
MAGQGLFPTFPQALRKNWVKFKKPVVVVGIVNLCTNALVRQQYHNKARPMKEKSTYPQSV